MYWGKESNSIFHNTTLSKPPQSHNESLQRQVETYTRKFEEEKRRLFRIQQNHRQTFRNYQHQLQQLEGLKSRKYKSELITLNAKIKTMEMDLEKGINSYNDSLSKNNSLKNEIDELRKHRMNQIETTRKLKTRIQDITEHIQVAEEDIFHRKDDLEKFKQSILEIKQMNEEEAFNCQDNINVMQRNVQTPNKIMKDTMKNATNKSSAETSDSQPIVKLRLKNLLHRNKERIRVAQHYKRNMEMIAKSFEEIKKESGINSLEEITKIFLKQEEQDIFIYEHISKLTNELENIKEENELLRERIEKQQEKNDNYRSLLNGTPEEKRRELQLKTFIKEKNQPIITFNAFLTAIQPQLYKILGLKDEKNQLTFYNYRQRLSELEEMVNQKYLRRKEELDETNYGIRQDATKYSRIAPLISLEEVKEKSEESILELQKLHEYACQFWQKKKSNK